MYSHHLQESQVTSAHIVKVDFDVLPAHFSVVLTDQFQALRFVVDHIGKEVFFRCFVEAVVVLARKQVDTHDTENQPKDEANQQHIHNGGDGTHQGVDYHLEQSRRNKAI